MSIAPTAPSPLRVEETLACFEREAVHATAELSRYRCAYSSWGEGPPLVLVHGLADRLRSFALPMALLSRHFRCITYNQPIGRDDGARMKGYHHDQLVADFFELLDHLGLKSVSALGHSYGSTIVTKAMATQPERVGRGVLLCGFVHRELTWRERFLARCARFVPGSLSQLPIRAKAMERAHSWAFGHLETERWQAFFRETSSVPISALAWWAQRLHETTTADVLPLIQQPVLLAYGEHDVLVRRTQQEWLFKSLPNATLFEISQCGHFPMWSHPEAVASAVQQFLIPGSCAAGECPMNAAADEGG